MSKNTLKKEIHKEIKNINTLIDMRIIKGLSYKDLSRRHKFLISQLNSLALKQAVKVRVPIKMQSNGLVNGFVGMLGRYASTFIF